MYIPENGTKVDGSNGERMRRFSDDSFVLWFHLLIDGQMLCSEGYMRF